VNRPPLGAAVRATCAGAALLVLPGGCGDGAGGPAADELVPRLVRLTPRIDPPPGESGIVIDLEVRSEAGAPQPNVLVTWVVTRGGVLSPALMGSDGGLQALWVFTRTVDPAGVAAQVRACARREPADPCAYSATAHVEVP
jgi:hypothetical protein